MGSIVQRIYLRKIVEAKGETELIKLAVLGAIWQSLLVIIIDISAESKLNLSVLKVANPISSTSSEKAKNLVIKC